MTAAKGPPAPETTFCVARAMARRRNSGLGALGIKGIAAEATGAGSVFHKGEVGSGTRGLPCTYTAWKPLEVADDDAGKLVGVSDLGMGGT
jgi:hypothetical protein